MRIFCSPFISLAPQGPQRPLLPTRAHRNRGAGGIEAAHNRSLWKWLLLSGVLLAVGLKAHAQAPIFIPPAVTGDSINLILRQGTMQFYPGVQTATIGYNGAFLGPTIVLNKGQRVSMRVENELPDTTTTHWHGLHVAPKNDGGPHTPIPPGTTWSPFFPILNEASTCWYHPHLHMHTMEQVLMGAAGFIIVRDGSDSLLRLPRRYGVDDFPLVCQFKTLDPVTHQFVMSDEKDNTVMVNGSIQGRLDVPAQMVRHRVLNGSSHRYGIGRGRKRYQKRTKKRREARAK